MMINENTGLPEFDTFGNYNSFADQNDDEDDYDVDATQLTYITEWEAETISRLTNQLKTYVFKNTIKKDYYEQRNRIKNLRIAIPAKMEGLLIALGWGRTTVDSLVKRTVLENIKDKNGNWLEYIFSDNQLRLKAQQVHKDAFIFGTGYLIIGAGDPEMLEPETLVTVESPFNTVSEVGRSGELTALLKVIYDKVGNPSEGSLYLPGQIINFTYKKGASFETTSFSDQFLPFSLEGRFPTGLPFIPAVKFINNPAGSDFSGSSELTPGIISAIDSAIRTLAQGEFAKEIYSHPQRVILNVPEEDKTAIIQYGLPTPVDGAWLFGAKKDGDTLDKPNYAPTPVVQQLDPSSPAPFLDWVRAYAQQVAGETGLPLSRLGYPTSNPTSAEAIKAEEVELVRNANIRKDVFDTFWQQLAMKLFYIEFNRMPERGELQYSSYWAKPDVQTPAADMDAALKLSQINPAQPGARVILSKAGLTDEEITEMIDAATTEKVLAGDIATLAQHARQNNPLLDKLAALNYDDEDERETASGNGDADGNVNSNGDGPYGVGSKRWM